MTIPVRKPDLRRGSVFYLGRNEKGVEMTEAALILKRLRDYSKVCLDRDEK